MNSHCKSEKRKENINKGTGNLTYRPTFFEVWFSVLVAGPQRFPLLLFERKPLFMRLLVTEQGAEQRVVMYAQARRVELGAVEWQGCPCRHWWVYATVA